jgi:heptosyltransferase II
MELKKILLRAPNWVGDTAVATPTMKAIRAKFPAAEITVMVRPSVTGLFASATYVDRVWTEPRPAGLRDWLRVALQVRRQHFDLAVLFPNSFESAAMVFLGGVPQRVGYAMDARGWMLTHRISGEKRKVHHVDYYLELAKAVSADVTRPSMEITARPEDRMNARKLLAASGIPSSANFLILSPGAAFGAAKRWGDHQFAATADKLGEEFKLATVIIGSEGERSISDSIRKAMKLPAVVLNGKTSLETLIGLIAEATLLLGNDSGPVHLAAALGVPSVAVFGATDYIVAAPYGPLGRAVHVPVECSPCWLRECPIDHRCMTRVSPEMVCAAAREVLRRVER